MTLPKNKDWTANEDRMPVGGPTLSVNGMVETTNGRIVPVLTQRDPQGLNPEILQLNLTLEDMGGGGTTDIKYRPVRTFEKKVRPAQHTTVEIFWEGTSFVSIAVTVTN